MLDDEIEALTPRGPGRQFVFYGDSCSGVPDAPHEANLRRINAVVRRIRPAPDFVVFPGDEIIGLVADEAALRRQWRHWFDVEMAWLDRARTPLYNATANHTTYDAMSERVFADVMTHLPRNGPPGQDGLAYAVRDGDFLLVVVHTLASSLGGEGHLELDWLAATLQDHRDARWKFVVGHHPAWPVNGYVGAYQRTIGDEYVRPFWKLLAENDVIAYLCSHILAFDIQCHGGVLQVTSAGAGTGHRMPEDVEYLHAVQMAIDAAGLRYQVLDDTGRRRERLAWPPAEPKRFAPLRAGPSPWRDGVVTLRFSGEAAADDGDGRRQTLLSATDPGTGAAPFWLGFVGRRQRVTAILQPTPGRSPHQWLGPDTPPGAPFSYEVMLHPDMGPGGILWRAPGGRWSTFEHASPWGLERLEWPPELRLGGGPGPFRGAALRLDWGEAPAF